MRYSSQEFLQMLRQAFEIDDVVKRLATDAGLRGGKFPTNASSTDSLWQEVVERLNEQDKLLELARVVTQEPLDEPYKSFFRRVEIEISAQERLSNLVTQSGFLLGQLRRLYIESLSTDMTAEDFGDVHHLIFILWSYSDRRALLRFMLRVARLTTNPTASESIRDWYKEQATAELFKLDRSYLDSLRQEIGESAQQCHRYLMVVVESVPRDPGAKYMVSLYVGRERTSPVLISERKIVTAAALEQYVVKELEEALLEHVPLDETLYAIEFYLPASLLSSAVEPHLWSVSQRRLVQQCMVVIGITERHIALNIRRTIEKSPEAERGAIIAKLKKNQRMLLLSNWARFWRQRWHNVNLSPAKVFEAIVGRVNNDDDAALKTLRDKLGREKDWACLAFGFSPGKLQSDDFQRVLDDVLSVGIPIILWADDPGKWNIFDQYWKKTIGRASEIAELVHDVRTRPIDNSAPTPQVGEHLTLVVDNPDREIPQLVRNPK